MSAYIILNAILHDFRKVEEVLTGRAKYSKSHSRQENKLCHAQPLRPAIIIPHSLGKLLAGEE